MGIVESRQVDGCTTANRQKGCRHSGLADRWKDVDTSGRQIGGRADGGGRSEKGRHGTVEAY